MFIFVHRFRAFFKQKKVKQFNKQMKRKKLGFIDTRKLITKAAYARKIGVTPPAVDKMVNKGYLIIVPVEGAELIYCE